MVSSSTGQQNTETYITASIGGSILELIPEIGQWRMLEVVPEGADQCIRDFISQCGCIGQGCRNLDDIFDLVHVSSSVSA